MFSGHHLVSKVSRFYNRLADVGNGHYGRVHDLSPGINNDDGSKYQTFQVGCRRGETSEQDASSTS